MPLLSFVPDGAVRVVQFYPAAAKARVPELFAALFSAGSEANFDASFGLRPSEVEEVVVAIYPSGSDDQDAPPRWLVLLRAVMPLRDHALALSSRLNTVDFERDEPFLRRIGHLGTEHREFGLLDDRSAAYGPPAPLMARVFAGPNGPLRVTSESSANARAEAPAGNQAQNIVLLRWFELAPIRLPLDSPLGLVLAQEEHLEAHLSVPARENVTMLDAKMNLFGEFPETAADNLQNFLLAAHAAPIGRLLLPGVELADKLTIEQQDELLQIELQLPIEALTRGAARAFAPTTEAMIGE